MKNFVLFTFYCFGFLGWQFTHAQEAYRYPGETYKEALDRVSGAEGISIFGLESVLSSAQKLSEVDWSSIPNWHNESSPLSSFQWVRDHRFFEDRLQWKRRLSWLYPDDGCFARAEWMKDLLLEIKQVESRKLFAFGELEVETVNHPRGKVSWWYHVVPVFRYKDSVFVFDPAIQPEAPLTVDEWLQRMSVGDPDTLVSLCSSESYTPSSKCIDAVTSSRASSDLQTYLSYERARVASLSYEAEEVLKDKAPWLRDHERNFLESINWLH